MPRLPSLALCATLAACATNPAAPEVSPAAVARTPTALTPSPRPPLPPAPPFDGRGFAFQFSTAAECESAARAHREASPDLGWQALRACVERGRFPRSDFTNLRLLLNGTWEDDLRTRPDAAKLIAQVTALRGGDIDGDLDTFQRKQIPVFTLSAAMKQPDLYKGRLLLVRAFIEDLKVDGDQQVARLAEKTVHNLDYVTQGRSTKTYAGFSQRHGAFQVTESSTDTISQNLSYPTGRTALGRLVKADPFLNPDKDFIFLVRFDGVRGGADTQSRVALMTVLSYYPPNAMMVE